MLPSQGFNAHWAPGIRRSRMSPFAGPMGDGGNGIVVEPLHEVEERNVRLYVVPARLHAVLRVRSSLPNNSVILVYSFVDLLFDEGA
jgi:hypothetical protein